MLSNGTINAADNNVRQGILDIFSGAQGATSRANLTAISRRLATRAEKLFASMGFEVADGPEIENDVGLVGDQARGVVHQRCRFVALDDSAAALDYRDVTNPPAFQRKRHVCS